MKKNYKVDVKTLEKLEKDASKVIKMQQQIEDLYGKLATMEKDANWLNYLGSDATKTLDDNQKFRFSEVYAVLNNAYKRML